MIRWSGVYIPVSWLQLVASMCYACCCFELKGTRFWFVCHCFREFFLSYITYVLLLRNKRVENERFDTFDIGISQVRVSESYGLKFPREFALLMKQLLYFDRYTRLLAPSMNMLRDERINISTNRQPRTDRFQWSHVVSHRPRTRGVVMGDNSKLMWPNTVYSFARPA